MFVQTVIVENINGIKSLALPLARSMNLICGPNGIGKSTILDSIAATFSHGSRAEIKKYFSSEIGKVTVQTGGMHSGSYELRVKSFTPSQDILTGAHQLGRHVFSLKASRNFIYEPLDAVRKDPTDIETLSFQAAQVGISGKDTKNWFVNRFLYSAHPGSLNAAQIANLELAKLCFSLLNPDFKFATVEARSNEILVDTPTGRIYYEYLSSGFKSCLSIMFGLIKEIEYRFPEAKVEEVEAIVLIDEIELHLHPEWQSRMADVLLEIFKSAQFICSTHSPHVIQNAERDNVIALQSTDGRVILRDLSQFANSFKGWTVEEILADVMGMPDIRTSAFNMLAQNFGEAIDAEDPERAIEFYRELDILLHPTNPFRKIARLQLAAIGVKVD